jgi:VWFA-related protein
MTSVLQMMRFKQRLLGLSDPSPFLPALVLCLAGSLWAKTASGTEPPAQSGGALTLQGQVPTEPISPASDAAQGLINLDVVVTDNSEKTISGLGPKDFTLLDSGQPQTIISFHEYDGISSKPDPPVRVILLIDTINMPFDLAAFEQKGVERFLRRNGGHLGQPVSIFGLSDAGFWTLAQPSGDGNALAAEVASDRLVFIRRWRQLLGNGSGELIDDYPAGLLGLKALGDIATAERRKPGKKLLVWIGPGWSIGSERDFETQDPKSHTFDTIYWFSILLREARVSLFSVRVGQTNPDTRSSDLYMHFLNGVESVQQASLKNLDRKVLAVQSGGRVLGSSPGNDLVSQIDDCIQEGRAFYALSFNPSHADRPAEYHSLQVQIGQPGLTARTNTGYYDQPFYSDRENLAARRVTVEQLDHVLAAASNESDADLARQLSSLELTERLSAKKLSSWTKSLRGRKARQALVALADVSAFLDPPAAEIPRDATPDLTAQRVIVSLAVDYLNNTIPKLPNFYATRTTVRYEETPQYFDARTPVDYQPLHAAAGSKATVLYSNGKEVVDSSGAKGKKRKAADGYLLTYGVFGPLLGAVTDAIASGLTWNRWEQGADDEPHAVFVYQIPAEKSRYQVGACCLPDGDGTSPFEETVGYHGEIAIDPTSGAILRLQLVADLKSTTPLVRSDVMIEYGRVEIGEKTYICPVKSVSISRGRSVTALTEWDESFRTNGPYATMLNDVAFEQYHMFRAKSRMLTGFSPTQEQKSVPPKSQ